MTHKQFRTLLMLIGALVVSAASITFAVSGQQAASPEALLGRAQHQQEVEGNVNAAIATYKQVIAHPKATRALVARALLLMGACYEQLGNADAKRAYERIVKEFSDLGDTASAAKARLADLNNLGGATRAPSSEMAMRRIYEGKGLDWCHGITSDGRYLSFLDWDTGNVGVLDIRTGSVRRVTTAGSVASGEFGECSVFSPDDRRVAFYWSSKTGEELRIADADGTGLRTVYRDADRAYLQPLDWSADGRLILMLRYHRNGQRDLVTVAVSDGAMRPVKHFEVRSVGAKFAPDGRSIVYSCHTSTDSTTSDVFTIGIDGSRDVALVRHPADDWLLGWAPDGGTLFFASDRTGSRGIWSLAMENGRPTGAPALVKTDLGEVTPIRLVNGTLYYQMTQQINDIYIASIDPASGKALSAPAAVRIDFTGSIVNPAWSPDGGSIAYLPYRGPATSPEPPPVISIFNLAARTERQLHPALLSISSPGTSPRWSPDGRALLVIGRQQTSQQGIYRVDAETGATSQIVKAEPNQFVLNAIWSRDGRSVFYTNGGGCPASAPCPTRILRRDVATGTEVELAALPEPPGIPRIALSPDGQSLAFSKRHAFAQLDTGVINVVPASGGAVREIYRVGPGEGGPFLPAWGHDGAFIYFMKLIPSQAPNGPARSELWRVTRDGQRREKVDTDLLGTWNRFELSADGRRIAVTVGQTKSELWALENLAPRKNR